MSEDNLLEDQVGNVSGQEDSEVAEKRSQDKEAAEIVQAPGAPTLEEVVEAISTVYDPEIPVNVYELGLIYAIDLHDDGLVEIEMSLTAPNCPSAQELPQMIRHAVLNVPSVSKAVVKVVWEPPWEMSRMSDTARLALNMF
ncbi:iron-sulfur cluster assembly protein [Oecophyllibacter saccharovorans]|uniref:iron-sulfur cluster assembly protein n=1 Tax=Oecophyllibacter saccharovorans TaxID=2558360 RepID=UPI0038B395A2